MNSSYRKPSFWYSALLMLLIYNFIFPIRLNAVPGIEIILYFLLLSAGISYVYYINHITQLDLFYPVALVVTILSSVASFSIILNFSEDLASLLAIVKFVFAIVAGYIIALSLIRNYQENALRWLLNIIAISSVLIAISCIVEFFVPSAKTFFSTLIYTSDNIQYDQSFRVHGLASGGGASLSVGLAIGSVICVLLAKISRGYRSLLWALGGTIIFASTLFVGRTGLFILLLFYPILFLSEFSWRSSLIVGVSVLIAFLVTDHLASEQIDLLYSYSLEPIKNYMEYGSFESRTTTEVMKFYYIPETIHFLFGAGFWGDPTHGYLLSDPGYMKVMLSYGIFGAAIFYVLQVYLYANAFKFYRKVYPFGLGFAFLFTILFFAELKEAFFTQNYGFKILILLIMFAFTHKAFAKTLALR